MQQAGILANLIEVPAIHLETTRELY